MIKKVSIDNYKSISSLEIPLSRINVFIGENGCGKSNILEAIAFLSASKNNDLKPEGLVRRGIRVAKPSLTFNSFLSVKIKNSISISLLKEDKVYIKSQLSCNNSDDIYADWVENDINYWTKEFEETLKIEELKEVISGLIKEEGKEPETMFVNNILKKLWDVSRQSHKDVLNYLIFNINTNALRGITKDSLITPLGINGEGLDVLISSFDKAQIDTLIKYASISWLESILIDKTDVFKQGGYKLGRSISNLYFTDKFMQKKNNLFSAENANEGALHVLFYLALLISDKTPSFFAIDNIETSLNPKLCRDLILNISTLAVKYNKQILITTHNPAVLDGLNLHDPSQRLFIVKRDDEGHTNVEQIKIKPSSENQKLKLSELWMRGYLGGLPSNNF